MSTTATSRDSRLAAERQNLFRAGWAVMKRTGYANASITEILNEAGISTRAFYRHFASKDDLLVAMFRENAEGTAVRLAARVNSASTPLEQLVTWVDAILEMGFDSRTSRVARLFASGSVRATFEDAGHEAIAHLYEPLRGVLAAGLATGDFPSTDPAVDAETIHAITWQLFHDAVHGRTTLDRDSARRHVLRFVLPALGASTTTP